MCRGQERFFSINHVSTAQYSRTFHHEMSESDERPTQEPGLGQRLKAFLERQIHERDEFGNSLGM